MREIIVDTETTGLDPSEGHKIIEIGCVELIDRQETGRVFHVYINPMRDIPQESFNVHGISTEFLQDKPLFKEIAQDFLSFVQSSPIVAHNAVFDINFINYELESIGHRGININSVIDTLQIARKQFPGSPASLDALCKRFNVSLESRSLHGALIDAKLLAIIYIKLRRHNNQKTLFDVQQHSAVDKGQDVEKISFPQRSFIVNKDDKEAHLKMVSGMKNPIWDQYNK